MSDSGRPWEWSGVDALPDAQKADFVASFVRWVEGEFFPSLAHRWPATPERLPGKRSPHGFTIRGPSQRPACWIEHPALRDRLLVCHAWRHELATSTGRVGGVWAHYHAYIEQEVTPLIQEVAHLCAHRHIDPNVRQAPATAGPPAPPPLPTRPGRPPCTGVRAVRAWLGGGPAHASGPAAGLG